MVSHPLQVPSSASIHPDGSRTMPTQVSVVLTAMLPAKHKHHLYRLKPSFHYTPHENGVDYGYHNTL